VALPNYPFLFFKHVEHLLVVKDLNDIRSPNTPKNCPHSTHLTWKYVVAEIMNIKPINNKPN
jgi:hypothetical protein